MPRVRVSPDSEFWHLTVRRSRLSSISLFSPVLRLGCWSDDHIPGLKRLADEIHRHGAVSSVQLHHAGIRSPPDLIGGTPLGPSDNAEWKARGMARAEVLQLVEDFIAGAVRAEKAGFHGVELHGAHGENSTKSFGVFSAEGARSQSIFFIFPGYILCAFNSSETNTRTDMYGGSLMNRCKVLFDIIDGIRARTGPNFQLGLRLSPERFGMQMAEQRELVRILLEKKQLDYLGRLFRQGRTVLEQWC